MDYRLIDYRTWCHSNTKTKLWFWQWLTGVQWIVNILGPCKRKFLFNPIYWLLYTRLMKQKDRGRERDTYTNTKSIQSNTFGNKLSTFIDYHCSKMRSDSRKWLLYSVQHEHHHHQHHLPLIIWTCHSYFEMLLLLVLLLLWLVFFVCCCRRYHSSSFSILWLCMPNRFTFLCPSNSLPFATVQNWIVTMRLYHHGRLISFTPISLFLSLTHTHSVLLTVIVRPIIKIGKQERKKHLRSN